MLLVLKNFIDTKQSVNDEIEGSEIRLSGRAYLTV